MRARITRKAALVIAALALAAGGTAVALGAVGSHGHHRHPHGTVGVAAAYLGLPSSQLQHELTAGKTLAQIAESTPGKSEAGLVQALIAARKARLEGLEASLPKQVSALVQGKKRKPAKAGTHVRAAILAYLGVSKQRLAAELRSDRTLAAVADATPGRSSQGLVEAIVAARKAGISQKLATGAVAGKAAQARIAKLPQRVDAMIHRTRGAAQASHHSSH